MNKINLFKEHIPFKFYFIIIASINLWSFSWINLKYFQIIHLLIIIYFIATCFKKRQISPIKKNLNNQVLSLMLLPLLSIYSCYVLHQQSIISSLIVYRMHLGWLLYFVLLYNNITIKQLHKLIIYIGLTYCIINIIQQITFPLAPFGDRTIGSAYSALWEAGVEKRFGFYRFGINGTIYAVFGLIIYLYDSNFQNLKKTYILFFILGIIACGNRQTIFSTAIAVTLLFAKHKQIKTRTIIFAFLLITLFFIIILSHHIINIQNNLAEEVENTRLFSYIYYWQEYISNNISILFGNGVAHKSSDYGQMINYYENKQAILQDTGILWPLYLWGAIYIFVYIITLFKLFLSKNIPTYIKCFILTIIIPLPVFFPLWEFDGMCFQALFFYTSNLHLYESKLLQAA